MIGFTNKVLPVSSVALGNSSQTRPSSGRVRVLIVDDEPSIRRAIARGLIASRFVVDTAESAMAALDLLRARPIDVVLLDHDMPEMDALTILSHIRRGGMGVEVVAMVAAGDEAARAAALQGGAYEVLTKPLTDSGTAQASILRAAERRSLLRRISTLEASGERDPAARIVGASKQMQELDRRAFSVAPSSSPVLILGERGTGKGLFARAIHQRSNRAHGPFVSLNVSALPAEAVEHELFGDGEPETGGKPGVFFLGEGGSVVLEEVGDLPSGAQSKLLRAVTEGHFTPVRSVKPRPFNVRLISTSRGDIRGRVASGHFQEELFSRLSVVPLELPPLRRRREDIPILAHHFLKLSAARVSKDVRRIGVDALRALRDHVWPGNVTELEAAIEQAAVTAPGDAIRAGDLHLGVLSEAEESSDEHGHSHGRDGRGRRVGLRCGEGPSHRGL